MSPGGKRKFLSRRTVFNNIHAYWNAKHRPDGGLPGRADIDPVELRYALGHLILTDVESGTPPRFRHRLVGSSIVEYLGYDSTGVHLDALPDRRLAELLLPVYLQVTTTTAPCVQVIDEVISHRHLCAEILHLPLAEDGCRVDMILSAAYFDRVP